MSSAASAPRRSPLEADTYEKGLAAGSVLMLAAVLAAIARGFERWSEANTLLWFHLLTISIALATTPWLLMQARGVKRHRRLGWVWATAMFATAAVSFFIHESGPGAFSPIHLLSGLTVVGVPLIVWAARTHRVKLHRFGIRFTVTGALLIAGFFTFPFGRMLGRWLLG